MGLLDQRQYALAANPDDEQELGPVDPNPNAPLGPPVTDGPDGGAPPPPVPDPEAPPDGGFFGPTGPDAGSPVDYVEGDPFKMDTVPGDPGTTRDITYDNGGPGPTIQTGQTDGQHTVVNPDGSVSIAGGPETREVQDEELVSNQLNSLLNSDSKYMQDARRQGMEQANATGGLGGTVGAGASMQAAIRAGLPIAQADAQAFQVAASENMSALNQYAQLNLQRATQLESDQIASATSLKNTQIQASSQHAIALLEDIRQRDLSRLDAETRLRVTEMGGQIQGRLAAFQHQYNSLLEDQRQYGEILKIQMQGTYSLKEKELTGRWESYMREQEAQIGRQNNMVNATMGVYDSYVNRIAELNGAEMDDEARRASLKTIEIAAQAQMKIVQGLYPDLNVPDLFSGNVSGNGTP